MNASTNDAKSIFLQALELQEAPKREQFLRQACQGDERLLHMVSSLLEAYYQPNSLLDGDGILADVDGASDHFIGQRIGPYEICEQIGEGGMGVVYVAQQSAPVRREVALKIIRPGMASKEVIGRFEAERQALAIMDHPHIAKVFDGGITESGQPFFAMELVKGVPITDYCDTCELDTRERLELFVTVCRAVQHAHQKGIIHRDLKPSNILVAIQDGQPAAKIIDFGVAKAMDQKLTDRTLRTQYAQLIGTPMYMSPEQAELRPIDVDTRSDIYSLGVLLYELLTGRTPFLRERMAEASFDDLRRIIREEDPPLPSLQVSTLAADAATTLSETHRIQPRELTKQLRGELDWIVMKALAKDRTRRYTSASDLADDIGRYLGDEPVLARPTSTMYRVRKFVRRNRALVASISAVLVALSIGLVLATAGFLTAQRRLVQVEQERSNYETVTRVLRDMYNVPRGRAVEIKERSVGEFLDELSDGLNERATNRPSVEIELRRIIAHMYLRIGQNDRAKEHLRRALELAEGEAGYDSHEEKYADLLVDFAMQVEWVGATPYDPLVTADYARRALEIYDELGIETQATADACYALAQSLRLSTGAEPPECEGLFRRELEIAERLSDENDPIGPIFALNDLAQHLSFASPDGSEQGIGYALQAVKKSEKAYGTEDPLTAITYRWLGQCYFRFGKIDEAIEYFEQSWHIFRDTGREQEPEAHMAAYRLTEALLFAGRHYDANRVCDELEEICRQQEDWEWLTKFKALRGENEFVRGDYPTAVQILTETVTLADEHLGPYHAVQASRGPLGALLDELGRTAEARAERQRIKEVVEAWASASERENPLLLWGSAISVVDVSSGETAAGRASLEEALIKAKRGLEIVQASPALIWEAPFLWVQAMAEHKLDRKEEAIQTMEEAIRSITRPFPSIQGNFGNSDVPRARRGMEATLAAYYLEAGRFEDAERVFTEGIKFRESFTKEKFPAKHLQVALAKLRYGEFLVDQGRFEQAEKPLLGAYQKLSANPEAASATAKRAAEQLARVCEASNRSDEAERWREIASESDENTVEPTQAL